MNRRLLTLSLLAVCQIGIYAVYWQSYHVTAADFISFYSAARVWQAGGNPYDLEAQSAVQENLRGEILPFAHPPVLLPLISLVSSADYTVSYKRWVIILIVVALLCGVPIYLMTWDAKTVVHSVLFVPVFASIVLGQDTAFILFGVLLWLWLLKLKKDTWAGVALSLSVLKPQIALLLAVPLLFSNRKAFVGFIAGALTLTAWSFLLVGVSGFQKLIQLTLIMSRGQGLGIHHDAMFNSTGLLVRAGFSHTLAWPIFFVGICAIVLLWKRQRLTDRSVSIALVITVFCSPHLHGQDLSLLVIPAFLLGPVVPMLCGLALMVGFLLGSVYLSGYVVMLGLLAAWAYRVSFPSVGSVSTEMLRAD